MPWFSLLLFFLIAIPIGEWMLLMKLASWIHFWPTLFLIFSTGFLGAWLIKTQGPRAWKAIQEDFYRGQLPHQSLLDGVLIFGAGLLLLTPGLTTDLLGLSLVWPWTRKVWRWLLLKWIQKHWKFTLGEFNHLGNTDPLEDPREIIVDPQHKENGS